MKNEKKLFITELQNICKHYKFDIASYQKWWAIWYRDRDLGAKLKTRFNVELPIAYQPTLPT